MIKTILFDVDGVVVHRGMNFSERYSRDFGIPVEQVAQFYFNEFQPCLVGKADLKTEIVKYLPLWNWTKSVDELLQYWFEHESHLDEKMIESIKDLTSRGIACHMQTRNEKYRTQYLWETVGLNKYLDQAFSSSSVGYKKPQPEFWEIIHERLGGPSKDEVLVWDNDQANVDSAKAFGFQTEFYTDFPAYENRMKELFS